MPRAAQRLRPDHERRDADAAADQQGRVPPAARARGSRCRAGRRPRRRRRARSAPSRSVPGPIASSRNSSRPSRARQTEKARPRYGRPDASAPSRGRRTACRTGPAAAAGRASSSTRDQVVRTDRARWRPPGRRAGRTAPASRGPCSGAGEPGLEPVRSRGAGSGQRRGLRRPPVQLLQRSHAGRVLRAPIARAAAEAPVIVVMQGMLRSIAARRISQPSVRAPRPAGVLITRSTSPDRMQSTTCGEPSPILFSCSTGMPIARIAAAVPAVASTRKPRSCMREASCVAAGLSVSQTRDEHAALARQLHARAGLRLAEGGREVLGDAHHLAGGLHLGAEQRVAAVQALERQHRLLDAHVRARCARAAGSGTQASRPASGGTRPWRAARRSPSRRTAPCATRAGLPRSRRGGRCRPGRTARS